MQKLSKSQYLEKAKQHAISKGGVCLSDEYVNSASNMKWKCSQHSHSEWYAAFADIKKGRWCKECAFEKLSKERTLVNGLELANNIAQSKGGKCLSNTYINNSTKMKWKCSESLHAPFEMDYGKVRKGSWCPKCSRLPIEVALRNAHNKAKKHGGQCLSLIYVNNFTKLKWQCANKSHPPWESTYDTIVNKDSWCPKCAGFLTSEEHFKKAQDKALSRGGQCLSPEYTSASSKMLWQCANKSHSPWKSSYSSVVSNNRWCPTCAKFTYYKENKVRNLLEYLLETSFFKIKPNWNKNPKTNRILELDGYSEELKIAFEFQGIQHYNAVGYFKMDENVLQYIKFKDEIKKQNCIKNNVKLLVIDDNKKCDTNNGLFNYLLEILNKEKVIIKKEIDLLEIDSILSKMTDIQEDALNKAKNYANSRGGKCLSTVYSNAKEKLEWKCDNEVHPSWFRGMDIITSKNWCKLCGNKRMHK